MEEASHQRNDDTVWGTKQASKQRNNKTFHEIQSQPSNINEKQASKEYCKWVHNCNGRIDQNSKWPYIPVNAENIYFM